MTTTPTSATATLDAQFAEIKSRYKPVTQLAKRVVTATRTSSTPAVQNAPAQSELAALYGEMGALQAEMAELTDKYGQTSDKFKQTLGINWSMTLGERAKMGWYTMTGNEAAKKAIRTVAGSRQGAAIGTLVDGLDGVLTKQYENSKLGLQRAKENRDFIINHQRYLERSLVDSLRSGYTGGADQANAIAEVTRFTTEIASLDDVLKGYEGQLNQAQSELRLNDVNAIAQKMNETLDIKYGLIEGKLGAEGIVSDIRRSILDSAKGIETSKSSMLANESGYHQANAIIDTYTMLEIQFRHMREKMIPVFQGQARNGALMMEAGKMEEGVMRMLDISQKLMEVNTRMLSAVTEKTYEMISRPTYDEAACIASRDQAIEIRQQLNQRLEDWAVAQRSMDGIISASPRYSVEVQK